MKIKTVVIGVCVCGVWGGMWLEMGVAIGQWRTIKWLEWEMEGTVCTVPYQEPDD